MKNSLWDIIDAVTPAEDLTERQTNPRRVARGPSALSAAVLVIGSALSLSGSVTVPFTDNASEAISVVHRMVKTRVPGKANRPPSRSSGGDVDFAIAKTTEHLAQALDAYFRPPSDLDEEALPDESCFF